MPHDIDFPGVDITVLYPSHFTSGEALLPGPQSVSRSELVIFDQFNLFVWPFHCYILLSSGFDADRYKYAIGALHLIVKYLSYL